MLLVDSTFDWSVNMQCNSLDRSWGRIFCAADNNGGTFFMEADLFSVPVGKVYGLFVGEMWLGRNLAYASSWPYRLVHLD